MATKKPRTRPAREASPRKFKKKTSVLITDKVEYVDYKDVDLLQRFVSDRAKIRNRRVSGNDVQQQRDIANAIKIAREMALIPYAKRVATTTRSRAPRDGERSDRGPRGDQVEAVVESDDMIATDGDDVGVEQTDESEA
jgi:small subunit ribosomal protein S18